MEFVMKKISKIVGCLLCVATCLFSFTACPKIENEENTCTHNFTWYSLTDANCTEKGEMEGICDICGEKEYL